MRVYPHNLLKHTVPISISTEFHGVYTNPGISASNLAPSYVAASIASEPLLDNVVFASSQTVIDFTFGNNLPLFEKADTCIIQGRKINYITLNILYFHRTTMSNSEDEYVNAENYTTFSNGNTLPPFIYKFSPFTRWFTGMTEGTDQYLFQGIRLYVSGSADIEVDQIYLGESVDLGRFLRKAVTWKAGIRGQGERTRYGIAYGETLPALRGFSVSFENLTDAQRHKFVEYVDTVQYVVPHWVEPYEFAPQVPPLYATLQNMSEFKKRANGRFMWDVSLEYLEAR
jgi:hypothetical protein